MGILIQVLPLIIQLTEAILGRGKGPQKLAFATELAQHVLGQAAHHGLVATADAHEVGFIQSKIHETVEQMKSCGQLGDQPVLIDEGKLFKSIPPSVGKFETNPGSGPGPKATPFGDEVDFSQI